MVVLQVIIILIDRNLIGSGLRTTLLLTDSANEKSRSISLYIGTGTMWENEEVNTNPRSENKSFAQQIIYHCVG